MKKLDHFPDRDGNNSNNSNNNNNNNDNNDKKKSSPCTIIAYTRITLILRTDADYAPPRNSDNGFIFHGSRRAAIDTSDGDGRGGGEGRGYGGDDIVRRPGG